VGELFPDTDPAVAGIAGLDLLARSVTLVRETGLAPTSCDVTVICDRPLVAPRRDEMREALAGALGLPVGDVSVKATRPEGLGLAGEGAGCLAVAVLT
jgi:2-C-methyl-D-erythritol 2,4-cyclodiphosphate synthase